MHKVLVNRLGGLSLPRKGVVRLTDRPDMTLDVYRGRKTTMQQRRRDFGWRREKREIKLWTVYQSWGRRTPGLVECSQWTKSRGPALWAYTKLHYKETLASEYFEPFWTETRTCALGEAIPRFVRLYEEIIRELYWVDVSPHRLTSRGVIILYNSHQCTLLRMKHFALKF